MRSLTPFLCFKVPLEGVVACYRSVFDDFRELSTSPHTATFETGDQGIMALAGARSDFNESVSFFIECEGQEEVDRSWDRLTANGGQESQSGWLKDGYGLSWQVLPKALVEHVSDPDREKAERAQQALLGIQKIDVAELDRAAAG